MANNLTSRAGGATRAAHQLMTVLTSMVMKNKMTSLNMKSTAETLVAGGILPPRVNKRATNYELIFLFLKV